MRKGLKIFLWTLLCVVFVLAFGYVTMLLWNWLLPDLFSLKPINFWQALGLLLLSRILFSGFGGKRWGGHSGMYWKRHYYEKLSKMTPEERERFKARLREKWCAPDRDTSTTN